MNTQDSDVHMLQYGTNQNNFGVLEIADDLIKIYLSNKKQFVNIDRYASNLLDATCRVPLFRFISILNYITYLSQK